MAEMNHRVFDICYCCGRIIGYAGNGFNNGFCSFGCQLSEEIESEEIRQQNYDRSYEEFRKEFDRKTEEYRKKKQSNT